jgi:16S rRNA (guanine527-N7)-methyltransferase
VTEAGRLLLIEGARELGIELSPKEVEALGLFMDELQRWNRTINLTAVRDEREIIVKHLLDALSIVRFIEPKGSLLDIGSGGGLPAIPLKILFPQVTIVSVDAVQKKIHFQRHISRLLHLQKFEAVHMRAEKMVPEYSKSFDVIVSRAFSHLSLFATLAVPLLKQSGTLLAMKGLRGEEEAEEASDCLKSLSLRVNEVHSFRLPVSGDQRSIIMAGLIQ